MAKDVNIDPRYLTYDKEEVEALLEKVENPDTTPTAESGNLITSGGVAAALENYSTTEEMNTALGDYATTEAMNTALADKADADDVLGVITEAQFDAIFSDDDSSDSSE